MSKITRNVEKAESENFELIIAGGGIYGIMLSLEASRRNIKTLLLEKSDFGGATTLNHLKTVHGGLRYLQSLDLERFNESINERKWFLKYFPHYVNRMSCIMPLYGKGLKRNSIMRGALFLNDLFSHKRNRGISENKKLPGGKLYSRDKTIERFNLVDKEGLKGGAMWYDANIEEFQRLNMEILHKVVDLGSTPLNYMEVKGLKKQGNMVTGVECIDLNTGRKAEFKSNVVINSTGPWSRTLSSAFDKDYPELFTKNLLLWNILFDREALSTSALGLGPDKGRGHTYFFHPWKGRLLIGTGEIVVDDIKDNIEVPGHEIDKFISDINSAILGIDLNKKKIIKIYAGILPASDSGNLSKRPAMIDHSSREGPVGLFSISGVKFTTSRLVAENTIKKIFPGKEPEDYDSIFKNGDDNLPDASFGYDEDINKKNLKNLRNIIANESVLHLSDLIFRRTSLGENPERALRSLESLRPLFEGSSEWWETERREVEKKLKMENRK